MGAMLLFFGFLCFNVGSAMSMSRSGGALLFPTVLLNSFLAVSGGTLASLLIERYVVREGGGPHAHKWSFSDAWKGQLAGLV